VLGCLVVGVSEKEKELEGVGRNAGGIKGVPVRTSQYRTGCRSVSLQCEAG
jgi:hypothetical protein